MIMDLHKSTFVKTDDFQILIKDNPEAWKFLEELLPLIKKKSESKFRDRGKEETP